MKLRQQQIAQSWASYQDRHADQLSGTGLSSSVPVEESLRRIYVVTEFMKAGIPLNKINQLRPLLEEGTQRLTSLSHMASYVPFVLNAEQQTIREELKDQPYIVVIFDGSTYRGEALVIILCYITGDFNICQRLVRLHHLAKESEWPKLERKLSHSWPHSSNTQVGALLQFAENLEQAGSLVFVQRKV